MTEQAPSPFPFYTPRYPWSEARFVVNVPEDVGDGTKSVAQRHRSRAMELIRRFGTAAVDDVLSFGGDDELGMEVAKLVTGAITAGGSAPMAAMPDGDYENWCRWYEDWFVWYLEWGSLRGGRGGSRVAGRVGSAPWCTHVTTRVCVVRALPPRHDWHDWQG